MNFSRDDALGLNLHSAPRKNHAVEVSRDHHPVPFDLSLNFCIFAENYGLLGNNISLNVTVDTKRSCERQGALKRYTLINESCPLFTATIFRRTRPLPS